MLSIGSFENYRQLSVIDIIDDSIVIDNKEYFLKLAECNDTVMAVLILVSIFNSKIDHRKFIVLSINLICQSLFFRIIYNRSFFIQ